MNVIFYNNKSDRRKVSKSLARLGSANCSLKEPCEILRPVVVLKRGDLTQYAQCNYMYIPTFGRYYFVKCRAMTGDMLSVETIDPDPLMSFANGIRSIYCTIVRQENVNNKYYIDDQLPIRQTKKIQLVKVGTYSAGTGIYLTVDGGNGQ